VQSLARGDTIRRAYAASGGAVVVSSIAEALAEADAFAPEHLQLCVRDAMTWLPAVGRAGAVFLGPFTPVPLGDYAAGTNHILPVLRMARFSSPLGVDDFVVRTSVLQFGPEGLRALAPTVIALAEAEGFGAHAAAVQRRLDAIAGDGAGTP
jgi:histidinol dehydrogenase